LLPPLRQSLKNIWNYSKARLRIVPIMIKRNIFNKLYGELSQKEVSILLGARQVGKSTLLTEIEKAAHAQGIDSRYYNLELSSDLEELSGDFRKVFEKLSGGPPLVFIDEFHYLKNASKIFKAIVDSNKKIKIYASGSSSLEIHKHLKESLAGRFRKTMIYPLTWDETQQVPGLDLKSYFQWGGMPGLLHRATPEEKIELLDNIVSTYLTNDIKALIQEENVRAFNSLLYLLSQSQGSLISHASFAREVGLSEPTVARHLEIMSQTYVCFPVLSFSQNLANELKKSRKYYLFDLGIRNTLLKDFRTSDLREDRGVLHESFVFFHLFSQLKPNMEIRFWRTKKGEEVDFILIKNRAPVPIEVKSSLKGAEIPSGIRQFLKHYPKAPFGIVFSEKFSGQSLCEGRPVYFKPIQEAVRLSYLQDPL